jgi:hypothetical protein
MVVLRSVHYVRWDVALSVVIGAAAEFEDRVNQGIEHGRPLSSVLRAMLAASDQMSRPMIEALCRAVRFPPSTQVA